MARLNLQIERPGSPAVGIGVEVRGLLLAGYTGRDRAAVLEHVRELEALGVAPPARIPMVFALDPGLVQVTDAVLTHGAETSGEVEVVLVHRGDELLIGVGSDHTDRAHEVIDVGESKGRCAKPMAPVVWRHRDVAVHWDELELRSWTTDGSGPRLYQEGTLSEFLPVDALCEALNQAGHDDLVGTVVFSGTLPTRGGLSYGRRFEIELRDPVLDRSIACGYDVVRSRGEGGVGYVQR